jgi:[ribosomal protein S18]-alanine N-acetyltransferase
MTTVQPRPITLQAAGWDDLDSVMGIMVDAFDAEFGEAWTRAQCAGILPMHGVRMTVARLADQPLGFSLTRSVAGEAELLLLAVCKAARRTGIGGRLVEHFTDTARQAGAHRLHLEVRDGNPAAELYLKHGFTVEGRRPSYYRGSDGQQYDALTMSRQA